MFELKPTNRYRLINSVSLLDGKYYEYLPSAHLIPYIKKYYFIEGFPMYSGVDIKPIGKINIEINFHYGTEDFKVFDEKYSSFISQQAYFVGNQPINKFYRGLIINRVSMFSVEFSYLGLSCLFNLYPTELYNRVLSVEDVLGYKGQQLSNNIKYARDNKMRVEIVEDFFSNILGKGYSPDKKDLSLMQFLNASPNSSVHEICQQLNINRRYLERTFSKRLGLSPKEYQHTIRFNKACELLSKYPNVSISDIIHDCSYYDQSHFIREFRSLAHASPIKYMKNIKGLFYIGRGYFL